MSEPLDISLLVLRCADLELSRAFYSELGIAGFHPHGATPRAFFSASWSHLVFRVMEPLERVGPGFFRVMEPPDFQPHGATLG